MYNFSSTELTLILLIALLLFFSFSFYQKLKNRLKKAPPFAKLIGQSFYTKKEMVMGHCVDSGSAFFYLKPYQPKVQYPENTVRLQPGTVVKLIDIKKNTKKPTENAYEFYLLIEDKTGKMGSDFLDPSSLANSSWQPNPNLFQAI